MSNNSIYLNNTEVLLYSDFVTSKSSEEQGNSLLNKLIKLDTINLSRGTLNFSDDFWDFSSFSDSNVSARRLQFKFDINFDKFKIYGKFFVLSEILKNHSKIQSISRKYSDIKLFLNYLYDSNIFNIESLTIEDIKKYLDILYDTKAPTTVKNTKTYLKQFLYFYSKSFNFSIDENMIKLLESHDLNYLKAYKDNNKYSDIPTEYFNNLLSLCVQLMNDSNALLNDRVFACIIVLLSQTGIRHSELFSIKIASINDKSILNGTKTAYYLNYKTWKKEKGNGSYTIENVFLNELSITSYNLLTELCESNRTKLNTDILIVPDKCLNAPVSDGYFVKRFISFSLKYKDKLDNLNKDNLSSLYKISIQNIVRYYNITKECYSDLNLDDILYLPRAHQFRVHLCTQLYRQGVPLAIIQKHMTHLTSDMQDYYIRPEDDSKKELEYSKSVLKSVLKDEASLIGGNKDALMKKINQFIDKGKFNVEKDIDAIVDKLSKKIPIKEKLGGICIKSGPKRDCSKDAMTDEFYCAYGICPNHFHLYTMIDITYSRYTNLIKTMNFNKEKGFLRQSEKEKFKLICVVRDSLIPELNELQKEITKHGAETIIAKHPNLEHFVSNFDTVYKEVSQWLN